jgi:predicted metal-binding membrane protein
VTQGRASGTGHRLWPVGALRTSAAVVLIVLLSFAALAWLLMLRTSGDSMASSLGPGMGQTDNMGMAEAGPAASMTLPLFLGMWVTMMVAMMFPSVAPMVVIYSRFSAIRNRARAQPQSL